MCIRDSHRTGYISLALRTITDYNHFIHQFGIVLQGCLLYTSDVYKRQLFFHSFRLFFYPLGGVRCKQLLKLHIQHNSCLHRTDVYKRQFLRTVTIYFPNSPEAIKVESTSTGREAMKSTHSCSFR